MHARSRQSRHDSFRRQPPPTADPPPPGPRRQGVVAAAVAFLALVGTPVVSAHTNGTSSPPARVATPRPGECAAAPVRPPLPYVPTLMAATGCAGDPLPVTTATATTATPDCGDSLRWCLTRPRDPTGRPDVVGTGSRGGPTSGALVGSSPAGGPPGGWVTLRSPNPRRDLGSRLLGSACASTSDCWAVGWSANGQSTRSLVERWNGQTWVQVPTPRPPTRPLMIYGLNAVGCAGDLDCWAVGLYMTSPASYQPLFERWDGRRWTIVPAPATGGVDEPLGVTCVSRTNCWAVGYSFLSQPCCGFFTLIEHWDGRRWRTTRSPDPAAGNTTDVPENYLRAVSCATARDCWAAGYTSDGERDQPLWVHWNGVRWTATRDESAGSKALLGVSCTGQSGCWTVGVHYPSPGVTAHPQPLIEHWDAGTWSIRDRTFPVGAAEGQLTAVACGSSSDCTAVGYAASPVTGVWTTLVERWTGGRWTRVAAPSPGTAPDTLLWGVTCPHARSCAAVGGYPNALGTPQPVALQLTGGAWRTTQASLVARVGGVLDSVTCVTRFDCWAVGYDTAGYRMLAEHWDGTDWTVSRTPTNPAAAFEQLYGIACPTTTTCWAVGWADRRGGSSLLAMRWTGSRWTAAAVPGLPTAGQAGGVDGPDTTAYLQGIACTSRSDCWAVGTGIVGASTAALLEHWDGMSWRPTADVSVAAADGGLTGVTCTGPSNCWAVGWYSTGVSTQPLIEHFDGSTWTMRTAAPGAFTLDTALLNVSCSGASSCWAVGGTTDYPAGNPISPVIGHWDGSSWQITTSANSGGSVLYNVACSGTGACWAVGWTTSGTGFGTVERGLVEAEIGNRWTAVEAAELPRTDTSDVLDGIACVPHTPECWSSGMWVGASQAHTLVEHKAPR